MSHTFISRLSPLFPRLAVGPRLMLRALLTFALGLLLVLPSFTQAHAASRLKDVVDFEGVRDNMLIGYGLVVGLNGTGDSLTNSPFTETSLVGMLERLGLSRDKAEDAVNKVLDAEALLRELASQFAAPH